MQPHPDLPDGWEDHEWIEAVSEGGPPAFHVRDQDARIRALPPCEIAPAERPALVPVRLETYPATIWLPAAARPEADTEDDGGSDAANGDTRAYAEVESWEWPDGGSLLVWISGSPELPGLHALPGYRPEDRCADIGGRPVCVRRYGRPSASGRADHYAVVDGHVDELHTLYARVLAATAEARDAMLAVLLTLTPDASATGDPSGERA
ncbi:hypothetical protein [Roseisolibacter agri]|uniref:Uncharacterized protein n=1 Tax=Roseisolibacter agri TaxID=2014610 RepID=A0AA37QDW1_9BACT|nr:hypothetical protein [Roseisolibacter agri]GLC24918.1 hypothetical protein rosag_14310 [Roseisolibacter agri]